MLLRHYGYTTNVSKYANYRLDFFFDLRFADLVFLFDVFVTFPLDFFATFLFGALALRFAFLAGLRFAFLAFAFLALASASCLALFFLAELQVLPFFFVS